jgi:hypothetical protein
MGGAYGGLITVIAYGRLTNFTPSPPDNLRVTNALEPRITNLTPDNRVVNS